MKFNKENNTAFSELTSKMIEVYGNAGMVALMFSVSSLYKDIIMKETGCFPLLHLYGDPATGKSRLADLCKKIGSISEKKPCVLDYNNSGSSQALSIAKNSRAYKGILCIEEYYSGNVFIDRYLKKIYNRDIISLLEEKEAFSYRCNYTAIIISHYRTNNPSLSSRMIEVNMPTNVFSAEETKAFHELNEFVKNKLESIKEEIKGKRSLVEKIFRLVHSSIRTVNYRFIRPNNERDSKIVDNISILIAIYMILQEELKFPFTDHDLVRQLFLLSLNQMNYLNDQ